MDRPEVRSPALRQIGAGAEGLVPGAVAVWLCEDGAGTRLSDTSGSGNDGTLGATTAAPAWVAGGLLFDGGDEIACGAMTAIGPRGEATITVAATITDFTAINTLAGKVKLGSANEYGLATSTARGVYFNWRDSTLNLNVTLPAATLTASVPFCLTGRASHTGADIFNGATRASTTTGPAVYPSNAGTFRIGRPAAAASYLIGTLHAVIVYDRALTDSEVARNVAWLQKRLAPRGTGIPFMTGAEPASNTTPIVLLQFDDAYANIYENAFPILEAAGMVATVFAPQDLVGTAGYMTEAQLIELDAAGWDIGNHSSVHAHLDDQDEATQEARLSGCAAWLDGLGLTRASKHVAYPQGAYNADTLTAMTNTGMLSGRTTLETRQHVPAIAWHEMTAPIGLSTSRTVDQARQNVVTAQPSEALVCWTHRIYDEPNGTDWTTAQFAEFVDFLAAKHIEPMTVSQLYAAYAAGWTWP